MVVQVKSLQSAKYVQIQAHSLTLESRRYNVSYILRIHYCGSPEKDDKKKNSTFFTPHVI